MNVEFHKNCDYTGKILKISCVRCNFVKFDIHFLGLPREIVFDVLASAASLSMLCNARYTTDDLLHL